MHNGKREPAVNRSVDRAGAILGLLAQDGWRAGAEVARELGVHRSTALRLLGTLERHALVERDPRTAKYRLGRRLPQLASVVTGELDLRSVARPVCEGLAEATGETVTLDVLEGDEIVPIEQSIAAPVYSAVGQVVAAPDASGPARRLQASGGPDLVGLTRDAAADLSRRLGFRVSSPKQPTTV